jgi:transposase
MRRHELTDGEWRLVEPLLPREVRGGRFNDHRTTPSGMLWVLRTEAPWRDLPERAGGAFGGRRVGTRFNKLAVSVMAFVRLAFIQRYLRLLDPSDTT